MGRIVDCVTFAGIRVLKPRHMVTGFFLEDQKITITRSIENYVRQKPYVVLSVALMHCDRLGMAVRGDTFLGGPI